MKEQDILKRVDRLGNVDFYAVGGSNPQAEKIYNTRYAKYMNRLYSDEIPFIACSGITLDKEYEREKDIFDPFSLHLVAVNNRKRIISSMRIVPWTDELGVPIENRYESESKAFPDKGFDLRDYVEESGVPKENVAEFGRFFRLNTNGNGRYRMFGKFDPVSSYMWKNAAMITDGTDDDIQKVDLALACAGRKLAELYSNFGMVWIPYKYVDENGDEHIEYTTYEFPVPTRIDPETREVTVKRMDFVPLSLSRDKIRNRVLERDFEGTEGDPGHPPINKNLMAIMFPDISSRLDKVKAYSIEKGMALYQRYLEPEEDGSIWSPPEELRLRLTEAHP